jgi:pimeloyl-ACP methyl ester carboxylesterase
VPERVVFIHSAVGGARMWKRQVELLRGRFDPVAVDLPGWGERPFPTRPFSFVEVLVELLPAILVGNSFGGRIALETALLHPDRVPKLMLVSPAPRDHEWSDDQRAFGQREDELLASGDLDGATELNLERWALPHARDTLRPMQRRAFELQAAVAEPDVQWADLPPLSTLAMPTLVVVGEHDVPDFHAIGERIAREAKHARLELVAGGGHHPSLEAPDTFDRLLLEFLEDRVR